MQLPAAPAMGFAVAPHYAGFWIRVPSAVIDSVLLFLANWLVRLLVNSVITTVAMGARLPVHEVFGVWRPVRVAIALAIGWAYGAGLESSSFQATLGKQALRLRVTDLEGKRLTFARATARHFAKFLSLFSLCIGYVMAGFDLQKQALHDRIAGTRVLYGLSQL